jgi:hypothetical protein
MHRVGPIQLEAQLPTFDAFHRDTEVCRQMIHPATSHKTAGRDRALPGRMTRITLRLTAKELDLLSNLASDQLFRREFIDPRLPGYQPNPAELSLGKKLVERLRSMAARAGGVFAPRRNGATG